MSNGYSLRRRLTGYMVALVLAATASLAVASYFINESLEKDVLHNLMQNEIQTFRERYQRGELDNAIFRSATLAVYFQGATSVPDTLKSMPVGEHHDILIDGRNYHVLIEDVGGRRLYLTYDITHLEKLSTLLIILLTLLVTGLSFIAVLVSGKLAARLVGPVTQLAERLRAMDPRRRDVKLTPEFQGEEVETIAHAFDRYMQRLDGFVEREQSFTDTASHELRTPLAIIQGAEEILAPHCARDPLAAKALRRIRRARGEMSEFIHALLALAREQNLATEYSAEVHLKSVVETLCDDYRALLGDRPVGIVLTCPGDPVLKVPPALVMIVVGNLLRNAVEHTQQGVIRVECAQDRLTVEDTGEGMTAEYLAALRDGTNEGSGIGLGLVRRICDRYGWRLELSSEAGKGTRAQVHFAS